jgi:hypothetical protein
VLNPCLECGRPTSGPRCVRHRVRRESPRRRGGYDAEYERNRAAVLAGATVCWVCGQPFTADDPPTADHVKLRVDGGGNERGNLAPAHASCNSANNRGGGSPRHPSRRAAARARSTFLRTGSGVSAP